MESELLGRNLDCWSAPVVIFEAMASYYSISDILPETQTDTKQPSVC